MSTPPPAVDEPGREIDSGNPNGFLIVVLEPGIGDLGTDDLREVAKEAGLTDLAAELDRLDVRSATRLISPDQLANLRALEERARRRNPRRISRGLDRFWRLDVRRRRGRTGLPDVARELAVLDGVDTAYAEATVADPGAVPDPDPADPGSGPGTLATGSMPQGYLDAAPDGVDARWAWTRPGGRGTGVSIVDIEQGWRVKHPALLRWDPLVLPDARRINRDGFRGFVGAHGTSVVGILAADGTPAIGVAPGVASVRACSHYDGPERTGLHVAAAVVQAVAALPEGGVLLLEVQRERSDKRPIPTETDLADFLAIVAAVDAGLVVIEAAGNGNVDVDLWQDPTGRRLVRDHEEWDSGAIMVGAAESELTDGDGHARWVRTDRDASNFGERVDCHAWGELVASATAVSTSGVGYRPDFNGTSAASAIVAGAAACAQGMAIAANRLYDSPGLRAEFRATGTPQRPAGATDRIGTMPDLRAITP